MQRVRGDDLLAVGARCGDIEVREHAGDYLYRGTSVGFGQRTLSVPEQRSIQNVSTIGTSASMPPAFAARLAAPTGCGLSRIWLGAVDASTRLSPGRFPSGRLAGRPWARRFARRGGVGSIEGRTAMAMRVEEVEAALIQSVCSCLRDRVAPEVVNQCEAFVRHFYHWVPQGDLACVASVTSTARHGRLGLRS